MNELEVSRTHSNFTFCLTKWRVRMGFNEDFILSKHTHTHLLKRKDWGLWQSGKKKECSHHGSGSGHALPCQQDAGEFPCHRLGTIFLNQCSGPDRGTQCWQGEWVSAYSSRWTIILGSGVYQFIVINVATVEFPLCQDFFFSSPAKKKKKNNLVSEAFLGWLLG